MWRIAIAALLLAIPDVWPPDASQGNTALVAQSLASDLPKPVDYVSDFAHVLSRRTVDEVDGICSDLDHSKADTQVAIVTIKSLKGADVGEYATTLANAWGVGKKGSNRGVLILLAVNDHKWRIAVGHGLEQILTNSQAEEIEEKMAPLLSAKNFDGAVTIALREVAQAVSH
jgi:uncharacterized protein